MKTEVDEMISLYGQENAPPPWQIFTIANNVAEGNLHFVQKVFDGAFEVSAMWSLCERPFWELTSTDSSTSCSPLDPHLSLLLVGSLLALHELCRS